MTAPNLKYVEGPPDVRRYDSCYYIIKARKIDHSHASEQEGSPSIVVRINGQRNIRI